VYFLHQLSLLYEMLCIKNGYSSSRIKDKVIPTSDVELYKIINEC